MSEVDRTSEPQMPGRGVCSSMRAAVACALLLVAGCYGNLFEDLSQRVKEPLETMGRELLQQAESSIKTKVTALVSKPHVKVALSLARTALQGEVAAWQDKVMAALRAGQHDLAKQHLGAQMSGDLETFLQSKAAKLISQAKKDLVGRLADVISTIEQKAKGHVKRQIVPVVVTVPPGLNPAATDAATDAATQPPASSQAAVTSAPVTSKPVPSKPAVTPEEIIAVFQALADSSYFKRLPLDSQILVLELASSGLVGKVKEVLDLLGYEKIFTFLDRLPLKYVETMITYVLQSLQRESALSS